MKAGAEGCFALDLDESFPLLDLLRDFAYVSSSLGGNGFSRSLLGSFLAFRVIKARTFQARGFEISWPLS